ncbi:AEC family transporter [Pseudoramibacter sp. HA2172]|uniref:AEC family transporter n=1 Tax=Pseudoramibacter faecis TaxID=3108534 RepID=UPI002E7A28B8|nr:AEC family transporter [Pseudoramibacter sp. HA2172]
MIALLLFKQIFVLFLMMSMGCTIVKCRFLKSDDSKILSTICLYLVVPCMQIKAFQVHYTDTIRNGFLLSLTAAVFIHILLFAITYVFKRPLHLTDEETGSILYSNAGNLIVPLVTAIFGASWVIYALAFMFVQSILLWSHGKTMMQRQKKFNLLQILGNINIVATLIGAALFFCQIELTGIVADTISGVAAMIGPISMIAIGMILANVQWGKLFTNRRIYWIVALKMIVLPAIILLILKYAPLHTLLPQGRMILLVSLLAVIAPSGATIPQMAQLYGRDADYASSINVITTLICIVTMPLLTLLYQR